MGNDVGNVTSDESPKILPKNKIKHLAQNTEELVEVSLDDTAEILYKKYITDENSRKLLLKAQEWLKKHIITSENIIDLLTFLMENVQKLVKNKHMGKLKKKCVMNVVRYIIEVDTILNVTKTEKELILAIVNNTFDKTIDTIVSVAKGQLIRKIKSCCTIV